MKRLIALGLLLSSASAFGQTITVKDTTFLTYNFSDPDPVPRTDRVYPYHRYNNFDFKGVNRSWKMVVLENEHLRVKILPEVGGKIWSIWDKHEKKELFYDNDVIKFREISLRGPWTSGGIEFNYGVIGHAPSTAHPVDWKTVAKDDGSVSCYIGVSELLTRTRWVVEINLPKDAVWVRTSCFWHNYSGSFQPYYTWVNSGIKASKDLELIYPAAYTIGHNGQTTPYPVDNGRNLEKYSNQAFGADKSFHPGGSHKGYFGAYWADDDFGMLHYALRDEKLGRKYFSWAQSGQGDIWVDLLTDTRPQYVELQSGRLFNQNDWSSVQTPYKQFLFTPFGSDSWNEYWLPFSHIGGVSDMTLRAVVNTFDGGFRIYPLQNLKGNLTFETSDGKVLSTVPVDWNAAEEVDVPFSAGKVDVLKLDGHQLWSSDEQVTDRPHAINPDFSLTSAQGAAIDASYFYGLREYAVAERKVDNALSLDPSNIQALMIKALICARKTHYEEAYSYANRILEIDEYNPEANYIGGQIALRLGKDYDAMDRFELAAITNELRSASYTQLAKIWLRRGDKELAEEYARKSLVGNADNVSVLEVLYQIDPCDCILERISQLDPLCHFPDIERVIAGKMTAEALDASIEEEMKVQNYLEQAVFYKEIGDDAKALAVLEAVREDNILVDIWKAWLKNDAASLSDIATKSLDLVFPFREEDVPVLQWAIDNNQSWKYSYLISMLYDSLGDKDAALANMGSNDSDYAPYYAFRATLNGSKEDLQKAYNLDPDQWRYRQNLALKYYAEGNYDKAIELTGKYYEKHKENFHVGDTYVKSLIAAGKFEKAEKVIDNMQILPFEGQSGSHMLYRNIKIQLAVKAADKGNYKTALKKVAEAREWPRNLGVGKPYDDMVDCRTEDWLDAVIYKRLGNNAKAEEYLSKLTASDPENDWKSAFDKAVPASVKLSEMVKMDSVPVDKKLF